MNPAHASLLFLAATAATAVAQTTTTHRPVHRTANASTATRSTGVAKPADNPPNVPRVAGTPKPLYALRYVDIVVGTGQSAEPQKYYTVRYTGWLTNGTKFDSSDDHPGKEPITFPYGGRRVIPGWDTGFQGMHVGGKRRLYIPYQLAYGEQGRPPVIPPKSDLIFDLELVSISDAPPTPPAGAAPSAPAQPASPSGASPSGAAASGASLPSGNTATPTSPAPASPTPTPAGTPPAPAGTPPPPTKPETAPQH